MKDNEVTLYQRAKTGKTKYIRLWTEDADLCRAWGTIGSKEQTTKKACIGMNIGKANETTPAEQAVLELKAKIQKKCDQGYSTNQDEILDEVSNSEIDLDNLPKSFCPSKPASKMPAKIANHPDSYGQRKRNGHCIILKKSKTENIYSRGMEDITEYMKDIPVIMNMFKLIDPGSMVLCELVFEDKKGRESTRMVAKLVRKKNHDEVMNRYKEYSEIGTFILCPFDILFHNGIFVGNTDYLTVRLPVLHDMNLPNVPELVHDWKDEEHRLKARRLKWEGHVIRVPGEASYVGYSLNGKADKKGAYKDVFVACDDFIVTNAIKGTSGKQAGMYVTFNLAQYVKDGTRRDFGNCGPGKLDLKTLQELTDEIDSGQLNYPFCIQIEFRGRQADSGKLEFPQLELIRYDKKPEECTTEEW